MRQSPITDSVPVSSDLKRSNCSAQRRRRLTSWTLCATRERRPSSTADSAGASAAKSAGFLAFRITQPTRFNNFLTPPFTQVLVQDRQPVPGQVYNILFISVRNGTAQTFNSSNGFLVRLPGGPSIPILTGSQQWKPGQVFVFYVLTKKYYPLEQIPGGFQLDLGGRSSTLIPGPSGIFLRIKYNPAKFAKALNQIVAFGQGAREAWAPSSAFPTRPSTRSSPAKTRRRDFGGHF